MTRRQGQRLVRAGIGVCVVALALGVTELLLRVADPISKANCDRITPGLPSVAVESLLGGPGQPPSCGTGIPPGEYRLEWFGRVGTICVTFDQDGRVLRASYFRWSPGGGPSPLSRLRAWLGW